MVKTLKCQLSVRGLLADMWIFAANMSTKASVVINDTRLDCVCVIARPFGRWFCVNMYYPPTDDLDQYTWVRWGMDDNTLSPMWHSNIPRAHQATLLHVGEKYCLKRCLWSVSVLTCVNFSVWIVQSWGLWDGCGASDHTPIEIVRSIGMWMSV